MSRDSTFSAAINTYIQSESTHVTLCKKIESRDSKSGLEGVRLGGSLLYFLPFVIIQLIQKLFIFPSPECSRKICETTANAT